MNGQLQKGKRGKRRRTRKEKESTKGRVEEGEHYTNKSYNKHILYFDLRRYTMLAQIITLKSDNC